MCYEKDRVWSREKVYIVTENMLTTGILVKKTIFHRRRLFCQKKEHICVLKIQENRTATFEGALS